MPIYEFYCPDNHTVYQFLARSLAHGGKTPRCPADAAFRMEKRVSRFAYLRGAKEPVEGDPFEGMDESKMEAMMADLERDMAGMDESNPAPRQLGHVMRKMTDALGDKAPPEMREMIRRLEAGEDPEKLESEFGDPGDSDAEGNDFFSQTVKKLRAGLLAPKKDAKLYEMSDWV